MLVAEIKHGVGPDVAYMHLCVDNGSAARIKNRTPSTHRNSTGQETVWPREVGTQRLIADEADESDPVCSIVPQSKAPGKRQSAARSLSPPR